MRSSGTGWGVELLIVFVSGFLVATMLWLGLWFFWTKPAQGAALEVKEAALQAKESALLNCVAAKNQCDELKDRIQAENQQLDSKLKEAFIGPRALHPGQECPRGSGKTKRKRP